MFDAAYLSLHPASGRGLRAQLLDCLEQLASMRWGRRSPVDRILKLLLFIHSRSAADFQRRRRQAALVLHHFFQGRTPPLGVIAQSPEQGWEVVLYAEALLPQSEGAVLSHHRLSGIPYSVVRYATHREIFAAGLTVGRRFPGIAAQSTRAFELVTKILRAEGMRLAHVVRQWNYIEGILRFESSASGRRQHYQEFNDVRRRFYDESQFAAGFPAATGIGAAFGGVTLEFQAVAPSVEFRTIPLSNPLQVDAHRYSQNVLVGGRGRNKKPKAPPLFERGRYLGRGGSGVILISGTAAVRGEESSRDSDVESQTRITIANIRSLISDNNLRAHGIQPVRPAGPLSYLRAYVKRRADLPAVKAVCQELLGNVPAHFLTADICREDLLVELEGVAPVQTRSN